jgi:outer membrane protein
MRSLTAAAGFAALFAFSGANAADLSLKDATSGPAYNYDAPWFINPGDIFVRVRGLGVLPDESFSKWNVTGAGASLTDAGVPEVDFTYFFTKNISAELIAAVTPHTINGENGIKSFGKIGDTWLLPPTLLLQYHFDTGTRFKPYAGVGVNYTVFFGNHDGPNYNGLKLDNNWGFALQGGFDYKLTGNWFLNFDVKKIWLSTDASTNLATTHVTTHVDIDPLIVGAGIGYHFGSNPVPLK